MKTICAGGINKIVGIAITSFVVSTPILITVLVLVLIAAFDQEAEAVIRQHSKQTVCIDGECKTTESTLINNCPETQCKSENATTTNTTITTTE
jgi:hypothetical protein